MSTKNWEERFDRRWPNVCMIQLWPDDGPNKHRDKEIGPDVKSFITTLLSEQREEMREKIEALKWLEPPTYPNDPVGDETWKRWSSREMDINAALKALQDPTT